MRQKKATAQLHFGSADCARCGWKMGGEGSGKNAMAIAAQHAAKTGHPATAVLEYTLYPAGYQPQQSS